MTRLRTASLRRRITVTGVIVITVVVLALAVLTDVLFGAQSRRELRSALVERVRLAEQLARQDVAPAQLVARLETSSITVRLTTPSGSVFGTAAPPDRLAPRQIYRDGEDLVAQRRLAGGSFIVLVADGDTVSTAQRRLRVLLIVIGLGAVIVAAVVLTGAVRLALAPLDAMTSLAQSITHGNRGRRLAPDRPHTELGRTARAFDEMLDALEGAEAQARASEGRTRRFVADAAHELRTPIAGVQAAAEAVLQAELEPAERERLQLLLAREAHRAGRLVEDLLALARIDAGLDLHREPVDLLALAHTEAERQRLLAPSLAVVVTGSPVVVPADPGRIAQVLANLLDNARHHTPPGGTITVAIAADATHARLAVTDTGPGVPPADRERIFDRLVRLDPARTPHTGAGLGLAIARGIAHAHAGSLTCTDSPAGARFVLTLPR